MRPFAVLTRVELSLLLREPAALAFTFVLPLLLLALNGSAPPDGLGGVGRIDAMVSGYLLLVMLTSGIMALPETLASYRERGFLRRLRISPLRPWHVLGAHAATHLLVGVGLAAFDLSIPASWGAGAAAVLASAITVIAIGFLLGSTLPTTRTTQAVAAALYFPAIFLSGAVMPAEALPPFAQRVSEWLPLTYAVRAIREAWATGAVDVAALAVLAGTTVLCLVAGARTFRWDG